MNDFLAQARSHWFSQTSKSGAMRGLSEQAAGPPCEPRGSQAAPAPRNLAVFTMNQEPQLGWTAGVCP